MPNIPHKLRNDLVISRQETAGVVHFVVKDPVSGRYFRFKEAEHFITTTLDGKRGIDEIQHLVQERFQAPLEKEVLESFIATLGEHGLLDSGTPPPRPDRPLWNASNPYSMRMKLFDPDTVLERMNRAFAFVYSPVFLVAATMLIVWAALTTALDWSQIRNDFTQIGLLRAILLGWPIVILVGFAHEFAHGLTCKRFGGEVREMGFMLMYFHPALYCNVSDAWLFPEKRKRLWVMFAGTLFEFLLWAGGTLVWRLTDTATLPNALALMVMVTSGAKTLLNFNPLLKLDGYYILSDILEMPNLRSNAFRFIRRRLGLSRRDPQENLTARERRVFWIYGVAASLFTIGLLILISWQVGAFLMGRLQAWGLFLFLVLVPFLAQYRLRRLMPGGASPATATKGVRAAFGKPVRILPGAAALLLVLVIGFMELKVTGDFVVLPVHNADVRARVDGLVAEVLVHEGDSVRAGQVLARLSSREFEAELEKANAELEEVRARHLLLKAGKRPEEIVLAHKELETAQTRLMHARTQIDVNQTVRTDQITKARSAVTLAEERLRYALGNLERAKKLLDANVLSEKDYETVAEQAAVRRREHESAVSDLNVLSANDLAEERRDLAMADRGVSESEQRLRLLRAGSRPEELEAIEAQITRLEAEVRYLGEQVGFTTVTSPISGIVTTPERTLSEMRGALVGKGDLVAEVYDVRKVTVEISVSEKEIEDVTVGQKVAIKARAYPSRVFTGHVTAIAASAHGRAENNATPEDAGTRNRAGDARTLLVTTEIPNRDRMLKPDMTGKAKIYCGQRSLLELLTRRVARAVRVEFWSWW